MESSHDHIVPVRTYLLIFAALMVLLVLTFVASTWAAGIAGLVIALTIAITKATLIILYFMHVRYSGRVVWVFVLAGFFWLGIMFTIMFADRFAGGVGVLAR